QLRGAGYHGLRPAGGDGRGARQSGGHGRLRHGRSLDPDVHPGAVDLQAVPPADQDHQPQQQIHGHGAAVAAVLLRQPLLGVVHGCAAGFHQARGGLRSRGDESRASGRRRGCAARGVRAQGPAGVPGHDHRPGRERVSDGSRRQGPDGNDPRRGTVAVRHILSILVENEAGALSRISGLFSARGYNIESLTVAPTEDPTLSRMTIVTVGSDDVVEQITKQLNKLVEVVKVIDLTDGNHIERELMLVKVRAAGKDRDEMKRLADIFRGRILDVTDKSYTIELTGTGSKLDAFLQAIEPGVILETVRTGASGIGRGERILRA